MPDFVYALHDFIAEHEDEIPFRAGERIEVVEKDDEFGDGWWQGRNLAGKQGLFPQNYTTPQPPYPSSASNLSQYGAGAGSSMAATLGDVQKALDQLGAGTRLTSQDTDRTSMSFASGTDDESESEAALPAEGQTWGNRQLLAEKARRELQERQRREQEAQEAAPPLLQMSDESESEDEHEHPHGHAGGQNGFASASQRTSVQQAVTPTLAGLAAAAGVGGSLGGSGRDTRPLETHSRQGSLAGSKASLPIPVPSGLPSHLTVTNPDLDSQEPSPITPPTASTVGPSTGADEPTPRFGGFLTPRIAGTEVPLPSSPPPQQEPATSILSSIPPPPGSILSSLPLTPAAAEPLPQAPTPLAPPFVETPSASSSSYPIDTMYAAPSPPLSPPAPAPTAAAPAPKQAPNDRPLDPNTWSTTDVLSWLTARGFDSAVLDKFEEQDITGDVLLSLDLALLKDELGISAFGKRVRLNNAIGELRRSVGAAGSPGQGQDVSLGSAGNAIAAGAGPHGLVLSPESAPRTNELSPAEWTAVPAAPTTVTPAPGPKAEELGPLVGLGLASFISRGSVPSAAGSDGTGSMRGKRSTMGSADPNFIPEEDESREESGTQETDKGSMTTMSKPAATQSVGSRSSHEPGATETEPTSAAASLKHSQAKDTPPSSIPPSPSKRTSVESPTSATAVKRSGSSNGLKSKKAADSQKDGRLSFFGGSLGKNRKPPPRYSSEGAPETSPTAATQAVADKSEKRSLSRYLGGSTHRKTASGQSNIRTSTGAVGVNISSPVQQPGSPQSQDSPNVLRKRLSSSPGQNEMRNGALAAAAAANGNGNGTEPITENTENALEKIGKPDHQGWMRKKGERYSSWKNRYFVLKGMHLYYLRSQTESKIKGYINVSGYKVIADENTNVGRYGFRIVHDTEKPHYFSSDEQLVIREWMKAIMKATIGRDYSKPVISSCNIPTIPLNVAQAMSPAPRPPSPSQREATQRALRPPNPDKLTDRDAAILMLGVKGGERPGDDKIRQRVESVFTVASADSNEFREARIAEPASPLPPRPTREQRQPRPKGLNPHDQQLLDWVNANLPKSTPQATDVSQSFASGLVLFRLVEKISGKVQGVPDALFMASLDSEDSFEGLFQLFDIMVENGISTADVSMTDIHTGNAKSITQLVEAIKLWSETR
ncbi:hypothetical protein CALCODRAFT_480491 [Calocera cornea HHB12733]|uniref:PH-domain-containing protein n=1 Tax=Calocera cornea HHB12733 TaxID=1353952 RepID=A0A165IPU2_9BASI|nr:hypothetical protein CALCODRAFT_480491 [Calocera cornea HHB12733]